MQLFYAPDIVLPHYTLSEEESKHCVRAVSYTHLRAHETSV